MRPEVSKIFLITMQSYELFRAHLGGLVKFEDALAQPSCQAWPGLLQEANTSFENGCRRYHYFYILKWCTEASSEDFLLSI